MNTSKTSLREALDLVARLAKELATQLDLQYDSFPIETFGDELRVLADAKAILTAEDEPVSDVVEHVLAGGAEKALKRH